jgi:hypothetical protein
MAFRTLCAAVSAAAIVVDATSLVAFFAVVTLFVRFAIDTSPAIAARTGPSAFAKNCTRAGFCDTG